MPLPETIDEVLEAMNEIVNQCRADNSRLGYFALLYREVTLSVKKGIADNYFTDGKRMEQLDVIFANRYLEAHRQYQNGEMPTQSWLTAFKAAEKNDLLVLQHLFLGMNAHINLDLGIAAAAVAPDANLQQLEGDFYKINEILFAMVENMQDRLAGISPLFRWVDQLGGIKDEQFAAFSLTKARDHAWNLANLLAPLPVDQWSPVIQTADQATVVLARLISEPRWRISRWVIRMMLYLEGKEVGKNMDRLGTF